MHKYLITGGSGFIGTHLINELNEVFDKIVILNIDIKKPQIAEHNKYWVECDINNYNDLEKNCLNFDPDYIIHLAARTDTLSDEISGYYTNIHGVENIINVSNICTNLKKIIVTSTQYVYKDVNGATPKNDIDYKPHTTYGYSKMMTEEITQNKSLKPFTIIRPTNIWGPRNNNYINGLFRIIKSGYFVLPTGKLSIKSYGYVGNICHQIIKISEDKDRINNVLYVGEKEYSSKIWIENIHNRIRGNKPKYVPLQLLKYLAIIGDIFLFLKIPFPLYSTRLNNMREDYLVPINNTLKLYGLKYKDLQKNIDVTVEDFFQCL